MSKKHKTRHHWDKWIFVIVNYLFINYNYLFFKFIPRYTLFCHQLDTFYKSTHLAFGFFLKVSSPKLSDANKIISQEIIIYGIDNYIVKKKLLNLLGVRNLRHQIISRHNIDMLINKMKLSGFFTHIDISHQCTNNHQVIYITVIVNPILKSIKISNFKDKLIPKKYILSLFSKNIGYPINFLEINKNLDLIQKWYHMRGYQWTRVNICHATKLNNSMTINISEGIINKIELTNHQHNAHVFKSFPVSLFLDTLQIKPNNVLNVEQLDNGILKLKQKKVIANCNYDIIANSQHDLKIYLHIGFLDDRYTYFFSKNVSITSNLFESVDLLIRSSLNHLFDNNHYLDLAICNAIYSITYDRNHHTLNSSYINLFDYDNHALQLLKRKDFIKWPYLNEWHFTPLMFLAGDNFGFRHYIRNVGQFHSNYIIDMKFPVTGPYLNVRYDQPWVSIYDGILSSINLKIYKDTYTLQQNLMPILLDRLNNYMFSYKNSILSETGISFMAKHDLTNSTYVIENITLKQIVSQYLLLHNSSMWNDLRANIHSSFNNTYYSHFKQLWINSIQQFFQLDIEIISMKLYDFFKNNEIILATNHFIPKNINHLWYRLPMALNCGHKIKLKFNAEYKVLNNIINFESELLNFIGKLECLPYSEHFFMIGPDIVRGYIEEVFPFPLKFGKVKLEYHMPFANHQSLFIFIDYAKNLAVNHTQEDHQIFFTPYYLYQLNSFHTRSGYGIGLQIKTPLKQIPPLRIEYGYNIHNGKCIHLRLNK